MVLAPEQRADLVAHAAESAWEVCGLIVGARGRATRVVRCENVADDPATSYTLDPVAVLAAEREAAARGEQVIAYYHSHPSRSGPRLSVEDVRAALATGETKPWLVIWRGLVAAFTVSPSGVRAEALT